MAIETLACPDCGAELQMGLPRNSTVRSVAPEPREEPADDRVKERENACPNGHRLYVTFEF
ncbi:transcriptional regulator Brz [Halorhabdus sp. CUG00001]|uniref:transcriptional regulator Brz n=1 Tax=Halorhabdus sp. CUG00001 TaxID=2600297 RepID=UPI00131C301C|nr:transcriptional regulator Brz [Halorhabdus sp. CUG00001]